MPNKCRWGKRNEDEGAVATIKAALYAASPFDGKNPWGARGAPLFAVLLVLEFAGARAHMGLGAVQMDEGRHRIGDGTGEAEAQKGLAARERAVDRTLGPGRRRHFGQLGHFEPP